MLVRQAIRYERCALDCDNCGETFRPVAGRVSGHRGWYRSVHRLCADAKDREWEVENVVLHTDLLDVRAICARCARTLTLQLTARGAE